MYFYNIVKLVMYYLFIFFSVEILFFLIYTVKVIGLKRKRKIVKNMTKQQVLDTIISKHLIFEQKLLYYLFWYNIVIKPFYLLIIANSLLYFQLDANTIHTDSLVPSNIEGKIPISAPSLKDGDIPEAMKTFCKAHGIQLEKPKDIIVEVDPPLSQIRSERRRILFVKGACQIDGFHNITLRDFPLIIRKPYPFNSVEEYVMWKAYSNIYISNHYEYNIFCHQVGIEERFYMTDPNYHRDFNKYIQKLYNDGVVE